MATEKKNPPIHKIKVGNGPLTVTASIWEHISEQGDVSYSITTSRSYKDKANQWHNTGSLFPEHLDNAVDALIDAKDWVRQHRPSKAKAA